MVLITLERVQPACWRRLLLDAGLTLERVHVAIQCSFGWQGGHLYEFSTGSRRGDDHRRFSAPDPFGISPLMDDVEDSTRTRVASLLTRRGAKLRYLYDFGDDWEHELRCERLFGETVEQLLAAQGIGPPARTPRAKPQRVRAYCLDGAGRAPPDDCGGAWGYQELLEILADPEHEEHLDRRAWLGLEDDETWDPHAFDATAVNASLSAIR
jgi:hypothetical protein